MSHAKTNITMSTYYETQSQEWEQFCNSWDHLCLDAFMKDNGKYRYRRYSVFTWQAQSKQLVIEPKQPHYQTVDYNHLNGGVQREYETFENSVVFSPIFNRIMSFNISVLNTLHPNQDWHIEAHQFRILTSPDMKGLPTPEGIHRDGRNYVMMMFIDKKNITGGETTIYDLSKKPLLTHTLGIPSETVFVNDEMVMHGVSPIKANDSTHPASRDMLVVTFFKKSSIN